MKNSIISLGLAVLVLVAFSSCRKTVFCIKGKGDITTEVRTLGHFSELSLDIPAKLHITQDDAVTAPTLTIEAQGNVIDNIQTHISGDRLKIKFNDCVNNHKTIKLYLTVSDLQEVDLNGSGDIIGMSKIVTDMFDVDVNGSGNVDLEIEATTVKAGINGSGDMKLKGSATDVDLNINGSGNLFAFGLSSKNADTKITGSGSIRVHATDNLKIYISGSGDVHYKGYPAMDVKVSGSGKVINAN